MKIQSCIFVFLCWTFQLLGQESLLKNPSFETPDPDHPGQAAFWSQFTESGEPALTQITNEAAQHGIQSLKLAFNRNTDHFLGVTQEVAVKEGDKLKMTAYFKKINLQQDTNAKIGFEWRNAEGKEISRVQSVSIDASDTSDKDWAPFELTGVAPAGTISAVVTVTVYPGKADAGSLLMDNAWLDKIK